MIAPLIQEKAEILAPTSSPDTEAVDLQRKLDEALAQIQLQQGKTIAAEKRAEIAEEKYNHFIKECAKSFGAIIATKEIMISCEENEGSILGCISILLKGVAKLGEMEKLQDADKEKYLANLSNLKSEGVEILASLEMVKSQLDAVSNRANTHGMKIGIIREVREGINNRQSIFNAISGLFSRLGGKK